MSRPKIPQRILTEVLVRSRRRCALCFGLDHRNDVAQGQVAHIDQDAEHNTVDNLVWLCLNHHEQYDSQTSQSKGVTEAEVRHYRTELHEFNEAARRNLQPTATYVFLSAGGTLLARYLNIASKTGRKFDPQIRIESLGALVALTADDAELAVDELQEAGLLEQNGSRDVVFPTSRLFWETDVLFGENDPAIDSQHVARYVAAHSDGQPTSEEVAKSLRWTPRRLNPAASYLVDAGIVGERTGMGASQFEFGSLVCTAKTKRFLREIDGKAQELP